MSAAARPLIGTEDPSSAGQVQALQQLAEQSLLRLQSHTAGLDEIVRDEIRRAFIAECGALIQEAQSAGEALAHLQRRARGHFGALSVLSVLLSVGAVMVMARGWLPPRDEVVRLRAEQARLSATLAQLAQAGGRIELGRCGPQQRLCARVELTAPRYGAGGDFFVLRGY